MGGMDPCPFIAMTFAKGYLKIIPYYDLLTRDIANGGRWGGLGWELGSQVKRTVRGMAWNVGRKR